MEKLEPCPECGGKAELMEDLLLVWIACVECARESMQHTDPGEAAKEWNNTH